MSTRDVVGYSLIAVALLKLFLAWAMVRSGRVNRGRWCEWPLTLEWRAAGGFVSMAILLVALGWLVVRGRGPIAWWAVVIVAHVAAWWIAFGWAFIKPAILGLRLRLRRRP